MSKKILFLLVFVMPLFFSCKTNSASHRQNMVEKQRNEKDEQAKRLYEEGKERHLKFQSRKTADSMKANKNKSEKSSYYKKPCFLKRWFTHKPNTCPKSSE
ncbi:MAG: hypothetical protein ACOYO1_14885 [Bacteroidales bacterium]